MPELWLGSLLLVIALLLFLWLPVWKQKQRLVHSAQTYEQSGPESESSLNLTAYQTRLAELDDELAKGVITEQAYQQLVTDLQRQLLTEADGDGESTGSKASGHLPKAPVYTGVLTLFVLVSAAVLYMQLGSSAALKDKQRQQAFAQELLQLPDEERISALRQEVKDNPDVPQYWYAIARYAVNQGDYIEAVSAYREVIRLVSDQDAAVFAEFAQVLFFANGNRINQEARELIDRVMAVQPDNVTALGMLGIDAFEQQNYTAAIRYWRQVLDQGVTGPSADSLRSGIAQAQARLGVNPEIQADSVSEPDEQQVGAALSLDVTLTPELLAGVDASTRVFVFARASEGPPMPLAIQTLTVSDLPAQVVLDDSMAMMPDMKLSSFAQVDLVARVSKSGQAESKPGDLIGIVKAVNTQENRERIQLLIDQVVK